MQINSGNLQQIFTSFNTVFNQSFEETACDYPKIAMEVPSETRDETYAWLGAVPSMREWVGDRIVKKLAAYGYTISNKDFEVTISVPRNDIEDDRYGVFKPMFQDLGFSAKKNPDRLVFSLLPTAFEATCFDGFAFIADNHKALATGGKAITQSNKGTAKLSPDSYGSARTQMMTLVTDEGNPLYIVPDLLVVSPQNEALAKTILTATEIKQETNIYKSTAELLVVPELAATPDMWFLLVTKRPVKPFIFQNRRQPQLVRLDKATDENVFFQKEYVYGVDSRCNAGYGLWQLAFGSTGEISNG